MRIFSSLVVVLLAITVVGCAFADTADYRYIPVMRVSAEVDTSGCMYIVDQKCRAAGSYIAADVSDLLKAQLGAAAKDVMPSGTWYSFLAADTYMQGTMILDYNSSASPLPDCTTDLDVFKAAGNRGSITPAMGCVWRWNSGRWRDVEDIYYPQAALAHLGAGAYTYTGTGFGVGFVLGNAYHVLQTLPNEFPMRFNYQDEATQIAPVCSTEKCSLRPNFYQGRQLMAVGEGDNFAWSDGRVQGGYPYTQINGTYTYGKSFVRSVTVASGQTETLNKHVALCVMHNPVAYDKELWNTSSQLQSVWWAIYLVFLFVICLVFFIVVACCQEREDMDEPPEDAPEWAREEVAGVQRSKTFVSQRSMQANEYSDPEKYEEMDTNSQKNPLLTAGSRRGSRRAGSQHALQDDPDYYPVNSMNQGYNPGYAPPMQNNNWV